MLSINISELIWTIINFFLLLFVLKHLLFAPISRFMDARQARVDAGLQAERAAQAELKAQEERLDGEKLQTRQEARRILAEAGNEASRRSAQAIGEAKVKAGVAWQQTEAELRDESRTELAALEARKQQLAEQLAKQLLREEG